MLFQMGKRETEIKVGTAGTDRATGTTSKEPYLTQYKMPAVALPARQESSIVNTSPMYPQTL